LPTVLAFRPTTTVAELPFRREDQYRMGWPCRGSDVRSRGVLPAAHVACRHADLHSGDGDESFGHRLRTDCVKPNPGAQWLRHRGGRAGAKNGLRLPADDRPGEFPGV